MGSAACVQVQQEPHTEEKLASLQSKEETKTDPDPEPEPEKPPTDPTPKKAETKVTRRFWSDIEKNIKNMDYQTIKKNIPKPNTLTDDDERWKLVLWKVPYGEDELRCTVTLRHFHHGAWTQEEIDKLYEAVSKYGINTPSSWGDISEAVNREPEDAMAKYGSLVGISVKKLKKLSQ